MEALEHARARLRASGPNAARDVLADLPDDPARDWVRAVASTWLGDPLAANVALRAAERAHAIPADAARDVALPLADAALADAPDLPAWVRLAGRAVAVHAAPPTPLHLAWDVVIAAADLADPDGLEHARLVLALGSLGDRLQRPEAASLLRAAQEHARRLRSGPLLGDATLALLRVHHDDAALTRDLVRWAERELRAIGDLEAFAAFEAKRTATARGAS